MSESLPIISNKTALLLMDFQQFSLNNFVQNTAREKVIQHNLKLLTMARKAGMFIIHVKVNFRIGYPEISSHNKLFSWLKNSGMLQLESAEMEIVAELSPTNHEPVITKHRISAFMGTDLDMLLKSQSIERLILTGVTTSGVVLSTLRQAIDLDYELIVVRDACVDTDEEIHDFTIDKIISPHALITSTEAIERVLTK